MINAPSKYISIFIQDRAIEMIEDRGSIEGADFLGNLRPGIVYSYLRAKRKIKKDPNYSNLYVLWSKENC
jgi:hypothetical protein